MKSENQEIFEHALMAIQRGERVCLVTVIETYGSSPRPVGSVLALSDGGHFWGSVSGGCIEEELLDTVAKSIPSKATIISYGASDEERQRLQLPCGGQLRLLLQVVVEAEVKQILHGLSQRQTLIVRTALNAGGNKPADDTRHTPMEITSVDTSKAQAETLIQSTPLYWQNVFGPKWRMLVIGAGPIARYLVDMAATVDIAAVVIDPRPEYAQDWDTSLAELVKAYPDDVFDELCIDNKTMVVALSHDPKLDDLAIMAALGSPAAYVGAMGSAKTSESRRRRLIEHFGFDQEHLTKLKAPIGLDIHSKTPAEIAVSILADLIRVKNRPVNSADK